MMNLTKAVLSGAMVVLILAPIGAALSAVEEIPITTRSEQARMDFLAGQAALDRGDGAIANALFRSALKRDPEFAYAWYNLGVAAFSAEEFAESQARGIAVADKASEGERLLLQVNQRFLDNEFGQQMELAKKLVEKYPNSPRAWLNLAAMQGGRNQFVAQRESQRRALDLDPNLVPAHLALANSYLFNDPKDFDKAERHFRAAIDLQPGQDNYYWLLGDVYRARGDLETARDLYQLATVLDPNDGTAPVKLGHVNSFLGNYDEARRNYDAGVDVAPMANKPLLANFRTFTWVHGGDPAKAVAELKRIAGDVDDMTTPQEQRSGAKIASLTSAATICMHTDMHDDAQEMVRQLTVLWRANAASVGTEEFNNITEANIAYFEGMAAARRGDFAKARERAETNARLVASQDNARKMESYHDLMGIILLREGKYDEAVEHYRQANLNAMYTKYHLARALEGAGETEEAKALYREVANWNFNSVGYALVRKDAMARGG